VAEEIIASQGLFTFARLTGFRKLGFIVPPSGKGMDTVKNFLAPALARRSRLAGHGSPVTARRFSGE